jgi:hypothetical protein
VRSIVELGIESARRRGPRTVIPMTTANAVPSPARESDDAERGERRAIVISHRDDDMTSAQ